MDVPVLQFGFIGTQELLIVLLIAVLLFGANKIPKLARSTGQAMGEFQKGREQVEEELDNIKDSASSEVESVTSDTTADTTADDAGGSAEEESTSSSSSSSSSE